MIILNLDNHELDSIIQALEFCTDMDAPDLAENKDAQAMYDLLQCLYIEQIKLKKRLDNPS